MNPQEFRDVGHQVVDLLADYLSGIEQRPLFPDVEPRTVYGLFDEPLPQDPESPDQVLEEVSTKLLPYSTHVGHPGYFGLITPSPTPVGALADFIASTLNQNPGAYTIGPASVAIERRTVTWLTQLVGYGARAGGNLTGGGMLLSHEHPMGDRGLELADSITVDPHKWFYAPLDVGAVLVKDEARLTTSFGLKPAYLTDEMDRANERYQYYVHGFEQSRRFRALKVWMTFKRYGAREIGRWIDANVAQAAHVYAAVQRRPEFVAATRPPMSAVCIRYRSSDLTEAELSTLHADVVRRVERGGKFW